MHIYVNRENKNYFTFILVAMNLLRVIKSFLHFRVSEISSDDHLNIHRHHLIASFSCLAIYHRLIFVILVVLITIVSRLHHFLRHTFEYLYERICTFYIHISLLRIYDKYIHI